MYFYHIISNVFQFCIDYSLHKQITSELLCLKLQQLLSHTFESTAASVVWFRFCLQVTVKTCSVVVNTTEFTHGQKIHFPNSPQGYSQELLFSLPYWYLHEVILVRISSRLSFPLERACARHNAQIMPFFSKVAHCHVFHNLLVTKYSPVPCERKV